MLESTKFWKIVERLTIKRVRLRDEDDGEDSDEDEDDVHEAAEELQQQTLLKRLKKTNPNIVLSDA